MRILFFTWKDRKNPLAGGAEVINEELARRLVADGHEVRLLVGGFAGASSHETAKGGYEIIRVGNRVTVYVEAFRYYRRYLRGWADVVIEETNTVPFFTKLYVKEPTLLFFHQLCRQIWFHELPKPLGLVGYIAEPWYLRFMRKTGPTITVSESSKKDLQRCGYRAEDITVISEGINTPPLPSLAKAKKYNDPTLLSFGTIRTMKQTMHQLQAFEIAKQTRPDLKLIMAGKPEGKYGLKVAEAVKQSKYAADISFLGPVSHEKKEELMQRCHLILVTSVKEGWGLIVSEAASQGTPAVVYDVDGLRDSVRHGQTGVVTAPQPAALAKGIIAALQDDAHYEAMRRNGWEWSKELTFERCYEDFKAALGLSAVTAKEAVHPVMTKGPLVSVIVTTYNNEKTLPACLESIKQQTYQPLEIVVVDNHSTDNTVEIAKRYTDKIWIEGPERCRQRNIAVERAEGKYVAIIDSDMELAPSVVADAVVAFEEDKEVEGVIIPEESFGQGFWAQCKRLERSFYVGIDWIEAARFFKRQTFVEAGGYNESLVSGEDWELSQRIGNRGKLARIPSFIRHNEGRLKLLRTLQKKFYYAGKFTEYTATTKQSATATHGSQPGNIVVQRFKLYFSRPRQLFRNPIVGLGMLGMKIAEFGFGAAGYAAAKLRKPKKPAAVAQKEAIAEIGRAEKPAELRIALYMTTVLEYGGGMEKYLIETAANLAERPGVKVDVITMDSSFTKRIISLLSLFYFKKIDASLSFKEDVAEIRQRLGKAQYYKAKDIAELRQLLNNYDVIYSKNELLEAFLFKFRIGYKKVPPVVFGGHTPIHYPTAPSLHAKLHNFLYAGPLYRFLASGVKKYHALNDHEAQIYAKLFPRRDVRKIYNPFDAPGFKAMAKAHPHPLDLPDGRLHILWLGRLTEQKGVADLSVIMQAIDAALPDAAQKITWTIVGDGELRPEVEKLAAERANVNYVGRIPQHDMASIYSQHDVYVSTSKWEGYPYTVLEAVSCGLGVIAYDIPGTSDIVNLYEKGKLVAGPVEIATTLVSLAQSQRFSKAVELSAAHRQFEPASIYNQLIELLRV